MSEKFKSDFEDEVAINESTVRQSKVSGREVSEGEKANMARSIKSNRISHGTAKDEFEDDFEGGEATDEEVDIINPRHPNRVSGGEAKDEFASDFEDENEPTIKNNSNANQTGPYNSSDQVLVDPGKRISSATNKTASIVRKSQAENENLRSQDSKNQSKIESDKFQGETKEKFESTNLIELPALTKQYESMSHTIDDFLEMISQANDASERSSYLRDFFSEVISKFQHQIKEELPQNIFQDKIKSYEYELMEEFIASVSNAVICFDKNEYMLHDSELPNLKLMKIIYDKLSRRQKIPDFVNINKFFQYKFQNQERGEGFSNTIGKCFLIDKACQVVNNKVAVILSEIKVLEPKYETIVLYPGAINYCLKLLLNCLEMRQVSVLTIREYTQLAVLYLNVGSLQNLREMHIDSVRFITEGIKIMDDIEKIIWQDNINSRPIADVIDEHSQLLTFVKGDDKMVVNKSNNARIRTSLLYCMIKGHMTLVENWEKLERPSEAKKCYETARLLGEKGSQIAEKTGSLNNSQVNAEQERINTTLKENFENLKQSYDLTLISEREKNTQHSEKDQEKEDVYTYVELKDPRNPEDYVYGDEPDLIFDYAELGVDDTQNDGIELLPTKEDILYERYYKYGGLKFKLIIADAKIYPGIILYLYNKPYEILKQFIQHYKDCADFVPINSLERDAKFENADVKVKFFEFLANSITYRDGKFNLKGIKFYKSMDEFITERSMHVEVGDAGGDQRASAFKVHDRCKIDSKGTNVRLQDYNVGKTIGRTYKNIKTIQDGVTRRLFSTRGEIEKLKFEGKLKIQFDEEGQRVAIFTDDYIKMLKNSEKFKHIASSDGKQIWQLKDWVASENTTDQIFQISYELNPTGTMPTGSNDVVILDQKNDSNKRKAWISKRIKM